MKAIILAAGYHTRLERDLSRLSTEERKSYATLIGKPKALLPVRDKVLLDYLLDHIRQGGIPEIYIVTNEKYYSQFCSWARQEGFDLSNIINDGSTSNEERKGGLVDLGLALQQKGINEDVLIVAGDLVFSPGFQLASMITAYRSQPRPLIAVYLEQGDTSKHGVVEIEREGKITSFIEKPPAGTTASRMASVACYILPRQNLSQLKGYLLQTRTLAEKDAPGNFIAWLHKATPVYSFEIPGRFDLGSLDDYKRMEDTWTKS